MGNSLQRAGQAEAHLRPKHDQYRRFNGDEDQNVSATSKVHPKTREQAERHEKDASLEHQTVNVRDSKHSEVLYKTADQSKNRDGFLSTEDLMSKIEERCRSTTEMVRTIREEGTINADIRKYLNVSLRKTEQELHTYNSLTTDVPANSPLDESESVMIKKIESNLHKSILQRKGKMHVQPKEPNEQTLIEKHKLETEEMKSRIETLTMENSNFQTKLDQLMGKVTKLEKENEDWMLRFSKLAGAKLVENNPAVADLSDPDRPLKLGDAYKQLYDDEWSDAFEALQNDGRTEEQTIEMLRETLQNVAAFCKKKAEAFIQEMNKVVVNVFDTKIPDDTEIKGWTSVGGIKGVNLLVVRSGGRGLVNLFPAVVNQSPQAEGKLATWITAAMNKFSSPVQPDCQRSTGNNEGTPERNRSVPILDKVQGDQDKHSYRYQGPYDAEKFQTYCQDGKREKGHCCLPFALVTKGVSYPLCVVIKLYSRDEAIHKEVFAGIVVDGCPTASHVFSCGRKAC